MGHVRRCAESYFIPDVYVIPVELTMGLRGRADVLEAYSAPLPLVVDVWSPSTGDYDVDTKIPKYKARGDLEIWRIHRFESDPHRLAPRQRGAPPTPSGRRRPDGTYAEAQHTGGSIQPAALPNVTIDRDSLFDIDRGTLQATRPA
jgi:Uma2 family endonuclease